MCEEFFEIEDVNYMQSFYCPGPCVNCNIWKKDKDTVLEKELSADMVANVFKSKILADARYFDLTGGESQLSVHYIETIKTIADNFENPFIHTNISGWYTDIHVAKTKEALEYVEPENFRLDISLDGREENYKKIRLHKDGFNKAVQTAKELKKLGIVVRFVMIIYKENYEDIVWLKEFAENIGVGYFYGYARNSSNFLNNNNRDLHFSEEDIEQIEASLNQVGWLSERRLANWKWAKSIHRNKVPYFDCFMGKKAIVITPYGDVYPCNEMVPQLLMGNLQQCNGDLDTLLSQPKAKEVLVKVREKVCQPCSMLCAHKVSFPWGKQTGLLSKESI